MSDETLALSTIPPVLPAQGDYDAICAALMRTERGRWFLQEYAKRNRHADTEVLLVAIQRIETVVRADKSQQAQETFRSDLLEMAKAITRTRAEVAGIKPEQPPHDPSMASARVAPSAAQGSRPEDVFAAAERIRDVTWAMRGHGFDPSVCSQLEELAASILSASSLRDPADHRTRKLSEVLQYLELRIDTLLDGSARPAPEADPDAADVTTASGPDDGLQSDGAEPPARPMETASGSQGDAADRDQAQGDDRALAPKPSSAAAVAPSVPPDEQAAELAAAAGLVVPPEDEATVPSPPTSDRIVTPADVPASTALEAVNGGIGQSAPEAQSEAPMEQGEAEDTLLPAVDLPKSNRIVLKAITDRAIPLISRESSGYLLLKGIEAGAAVWDFSLPQEVLSAEASTPIQSDQADIAEVEQLDGESIQAEETTIEMGLIEAAQGESADANAVQAELAQTESVQAEAECTQGEAAPGEASQSEASQPEAIQLEASGVEAVDLVVEPTSEDSQALNSTLGEAAGEPAPEDTALIVPPSIPAPAATEAEPDAAPPKIEPARSAAVPPELIARPLPSANDPLAALRAMSDEERIALFT